MTGFGSGNDTVFADAPPRARRWADVEASEGESDEETEEVAVVLAPPITDDSYRDAPVAVLEDSRGGLNGRLRGALGPESGPADFAFLVGQDVDRLGKTTREPEEEDLDIDRLLAEGSVPPAATTAVQPLNADAPEFVPTLSMVCPLVGFCSVGSCSEDGGAPPEEGAPKASAGPPDPAAPGSLPSQPLQRPPHDWRRRGGAGCKRSTPPAMQAPARKRTKSEERRHGLPANMPMPEASEVEWESRIRKRQFAIDVSKRTPEYQRFRRLKMHEKREEDEPLTPDPTDRAVSKRKWKHDVELWRNWLHKRYADEGHGSVGSTEELLSVFTSTTEEADGTATTVDGDDDAKDALGMGVASCFDEGEGDEGEDAASV